MKQPVRIALATAFTLGTGMSLAADVLTVASPWVRGTVPTQKATGAFMELSSKEPVAVVGAESPVAKIVELHQTSMDGGVMRMRPVARIAVKPGETVSLKPGGYHVMLIDLAQQMKPGEKVPLKLVVERADKSRVNVDVTAEVRTLAGTPGHGGMHDKK